MNQNKYIIHLIIAFLGFYTEGTFAQVAINTDGSAAGTNTMLDLNPAIGKAFVPPKMTWAQIKAISPASEGMMVYDTEFKTIRFYNGTKWVSLLQPTDPSAPTGNISTQTQFASMDGIGTDAAGNVYITGSFSGSTTFGGITVTTGNFYLVKYNNSGIASWVQTGTNVSTVKGLAVDAAGNAHIIGTFTGTVTLGSLPSMSSFATIKPDVFVVKFNTSGTALWQKQENGGMNGPNNYGAAIAVDASANVYATGRINSSDMVTFSVIPANFLIKYNAAGTTLWTNIAISSLASNMTVDGSGNTYLLYGAAIEKFNTAGTLLWNKGTTNGSPLSAKTDVAGNLYVTGSFNGTGTFSTSPSVTLTSAGGTDIFIAEYNSAGTLQWAKRAGGTSNESGTSITIDASNNLYITGQFSGTASFGALPSALTSAGSTDVFIAKYNNSGTEQWIQKAGGTGNDLGTGIAIDGAGNLYTVGNFTPSALFGTQTLTTGTMFLMKYSE
jgi:hypothetical protein